jgi:hypothetical protein
LVAVFVPRDVAIAQRNYAIAIIARRRGALIAAHQVNHEDIEKRPEAGMSPTVLRQHGPGGYAQQVSSVDQEISPPTFVPKAREY